MITSPKQLRNKSTQICNFTGFYTLSLSFSLFFVTLFLSILLGLSLSVSVSLSLSLSLILTYLYLHKVYFLPNFSQNNVRLSVTWTQDEIREYTWTVRRLEKYENKGMDSLFLFIPRWMTYPDTVIMLLCNLYLYKTFVLYEIHLFSV